MDGDGRRWTAMDGDGRRWTAMDSDGRRWTAMDGDGQRWTAMIVARFRRDSVRATANRTGAPPLSALRRQGRFARCLELISGNPRWQEVALRDLIRGPQYAATTMDNDGQR
jgi:hypothetical protein